MTHSLSYKIATKKITSKQRNNKIEATKDECKALADRLNILEISNIVANLILEYKNGLIYVSGILSCDVLQECVVTLEPVPKHIEKEFEALFYASAKELTENTIINDRTVDSIKNGMIDLGEVISQQISLVLEDFPKAKNVAFSNHIEAPDAIKTPDERTHRPFIDLLQNIKINNKSED